MDILITEEAFAAIVDAVREGRRRRIELGGSLIAHEREGDILIAYALPTGPHAEQGPARVLTDAAFQNDAMSRVRAGAPELSYVGDWHIHPMWLPHLSAMDRDTAREILLGERAHRTDLILVLGTCAAGCEPQVLAFVASLDADSRLRVREQPIRRLATADVASRLGRTLPPLAELLAGEAAPPEMIEHGSAVRIEADLDEIRSELGVDAHTWTVDDNIGATIRRGKREVTVLFPPEYPLGAPQVFSGSLHPGPLEPVALRYAWSSRHRLLDPIEEALTAPPPRERPAARPRLFRRMLAAFMQIRPWRALTQGDRSTASTAKPLPRKEATP